MKATQEQIESGQFGQITPSSEFGKVLTSLARNAETIVELGTWKGLGSTYCLYLGMERPTQKLLTVEYCKEFYTLAKSFYDDPRVTFLHGTLSHQAEFDEFSFPEPDYRKHYDADLEINKAAPFVIDQIPEAIDLLMIDAGAWVGRSQFLKLWHRAKVIALDDTNEARTCKNIKNRQQLLDAGWIVLADRLDDRAGWSVFQRP